MKKLLAMTLSAAMVLSMASVAFASTQYNVMMKQGTPVCSTPLSWCDDDDEDFVYVTDEDEVPYGDTVYFALNGVASPDGIVKKAVEEDITYLVTESDAVKGLKIKAKWAAGKNLVKNVTVVKKKINTDANADLTVYIPKDKNIVGADKSYYVGSKKYAYFIAVELNDSMSTSKKYVSGELELSKSSNGKTKADGTRYDDKIDDVTFDVDFDVAFEEKEDLSVYENKATMVFDDGDEEEEILLIGGDEKDSSDETARFVVDTRGQGDLVMACNTEFVADVAAKYPSANLEFLNVTSGTFNKIGTLYVNAEEGNYLYALNADGTVKKANAKYDDVEEAYVLKTRNLGSFVISDEKLSTSSVVSDVDVDEDDEVIETPAVETPSINAPSNPPTGAAC